MHFQAVFCGRPLRFSEYFKPKISSSSKSLMDRIDRESMYRHRNRKLALRALGWVYFLLASAVWNRFLTAFCRYFCANVSAVTYVNASSGHHLTHCGSLVSLSVQLLHVNTTFLSGCMFMAPNWQALARTASISLKAPLSYIKSECVCSRELLIDSKLKNS